MYEHERKTRDRLHRHVPLLTPPSPPPGECGCCTASAPAARAFRTIPIGLASVLLLFILALAASAEAPLPLPHVPRGGGGGGGPTCSQQAFPPYEYDNVIPGRRLGVLARTRGRALKAWKRLLQMKAIDNIQPSAASCGGDDKSSSESQQRSERRLQVVPGYNSGGSSPKMVSSSTEEASEQPGPKLVIAGKMTIDEGPCNVGEMNLETGEWSTKQRIQLSLYNSYSGGEVYSMLPNLTFPVGTSASGDAGGADAKAATVRSGGDLILVGAFDTTYRNSQVTYCSVGRFDGEVLSKVGEGLCNSALSRGMKITTAALAGPQDVFVAGSFQTQVWNGDSHEFVNIYNLAHFNAVDQVWMPLRVGQLACSWCTVTVLSLAWDSKRNQLHVAGKFNAIDGRNIPAGLAIYEQSSGHLVAHPGGGLAMKNITQDGVATSLQLDEESGVLYVMGSFDRLTATGEYCAGLAAYEIENNHWTCLADSAHSVLPTVGGTMLLTPYGLMAAGKVTTSTTWPNADRPYTIALLKSTLRTNSDTDDDTSDNDDIVGHQEEDSESSLSLVKSMILKATQDKNQDANGSDSIKRDSGPKHEFNWSWLPGFEGWMEPIHTLANGFGAYNGVVFIGGDNLVAKWYYETKYEVVKGEGGDSSANTGTGTTAASSAKSSATSSHQDANGPGRSLSSTDQTKVMVRTPVTVDLGAGHVRGVIMAISQLNPPDLDDIPGGGGGGGGGDKRRPSVIGYTIVVYCVALGAVFGMLLALLCNRSLNSTILSYFFDKDANAKGISLDTLTYSAVQNTNVAEAYQRAMRTRFVQHPHLLTLIDPQEIILHRIIGEGTFGRVWSARWRSSSVAVKEFVFAQAAVAGKSQQQNVIMEEIIGEAGMMAILRHPNVLQLFGCSLTAQAIWIVSELCSLGSLRQLLDDQDRQLSPRSKVSLALQVAEGMTYLHTQDPPIIHRDLKSHNILCHETFIETDTRDMEKGNRTRSRKSSSKSKSKSKSDGRSLSGSTYSQKAALAATVKNGKMNSESTIVAKIGDWGSARATLAGSRTMTHGVGTACWLAPEVITHARSSKLSDVYGFGIILWELATREEVYQGLESTQIIARVANDNLRPQPPRNCLWKDLMVKCWSENPKNRPSFEEIMIELGTLLDTLPADEAAGTVDGADEKNIFKRVTYSTYQK